jgi:hypothetical protein
MRHWLQTLFARKRPAARRHSSFHPGLECLEARLTPTTVSLTSPLDTHGASLFRSGLASTAKTATPRPKAASILRASVPLSPTTLLLRFSKKLGPGANDPDSYDIPGLTVISVKVSKDRKTVILTTTPMTDASYTIGLRHLRTRDGSRVGIAININTVSVNPPTPPPSDTTPPRVVGAASTGNHAVLVSFSEAMDDSALNPQHYVIVQGNVNPEAGTLRVLAAKFINGDRSVVELATDSQNELTYNLTVVNVKDLAGNTFGPPALAGTAFGLPALAGGQWVDPSRASFPGTPASGAGLTDSDHDGLTDNEEQRGWTATFKLIDGKVVTRGVTSDPLNPDTDGDGLPDAEERTLGLDPRSADTDGDQLTDNQEFNEIFSDPTNQDSDGDGLDDGLEFNFFRTSPTQADTDGDQLLDGQEVLLANRNARISDLPAPTLEVGGVNLGLDVRFTETTSTETRQLDSRTVTSSLSQDETRAQSNSQSATAGFEAKLTVSTGYEVEAGGPWKAGGKWNSSIEEEHGISGSWTGEWTESSSQETQREYGKSLNTESETTRGATVERQVVGARMQATVALKNAGTIAFHIKNLQVTAFIQDPQDPAHLIPVATLLPDSEPAEGFTLGPLLPQRGPFIFSNDTIFPNLVESLMKNPRGLVFKISNYDISDEFGRNFAFTSRDVLDRTGSLTIDFGGFDSDGDGEGDLTEYHRISTGAGRVIDTNGDGVIDGSDHRVVFDANGTQVGITLREALAALGLTHYDEQATPTDSLTAEQVQNSYSTIIDDGGVERIYRVRGTAPADDLGASRSARKRWEVITPTGIDHTLGLDNLILTTASDIKLAFVQDLDGDRLPASVEFLGHTSDRLRDTDSDGLDDRFETLIGWDVDLGGRGSIHVYSSGSLKDTDADGLTDTQEAPANLIDKDGDGLTDVARPAGADDFVTDPQHPDTDRDGISDRDEVTGYPITLRRTGETLTFHTDPALFDTDGDTASDGVERRLGGDPTDIGDRDDFADDDGDGLANIEERDGWDVTVYHVSTVANVQGAAAVLHVTSDPGKADTDGDGLSDGEEFTNASNPRNTDTDSDGLTDFQEVRGIIVRDLGVITLKANDADTDNDKLSDGREAELTDVEANRWVVRVRGLDAYRVFSNPLLADADFDRLVDGDEAAQGSDPTKANTDSDTRDDYEEFLRHTDPLAEDVRVTVVYTSLVIDSDSDDGGNEGDIGFDFGVRLPNAVTDTGLALAPTHLVVEQILANGAGDYQYTSRSDVESRVGGDPNSFGLSIQSGTTVSLVGILPLASRSLTFDLRRGEEFTLEGVVHDQDEVHPDYVLGSWVYFGGLGGVPATVGDGQTVSVFEADSLFDQTFQTFAFHFHAGDNIGFDTNGGGLQGAVTGYYFIN